MNNNHQKAKPSVGFIGLGVMGHRMLANMTTHGGFNIASSWDPDHQVCELVKQNYPEIKYPKRLKT